MVNMIWFCMIVGGIVYSALTGNLGILNNTILDSCKTCFDMIIKIFPVIGLWLGLMKIAENSGLLERLSKYLYPILSKLFPEIPKNNEAFGLIAGNIIANIFGLGSAATPIGLKVMTSLQKINKNKNIASRSMITFLVMNTSGLTLIPTTVISLRIMCKSVNPTQFVLASILATLCSTIGGLLIDYVLARRFNN